MGGRAFSPPFRKILPLLLPFAGAHLHGLQHDLADDAARVEASRQERQEVAVLREVLRGRGRAGLAAVTQIGRLEPARAPAK